MTPNRAIPLGVFESSRISATYVFETPKFPFRNPHRNRAMTATKKVGANPNSVADMAVPMRPYSKAGRRPYLSAINPHMKLPIKLPQLNAEPTRNDYVIKSLRTVD
jgi:hypothetical protein